MAVPTIKDLWAALAKGNYVSGRDYQVRGNPATDDNMAWLDWLHADPKPTEAQMLVWWGIVDAELNAALALKTAQLGLKDKASLAKTYSVEIKTLWNVCLDQLETNASHPSRFNAVLVAVNALPAALKNRVNKGTADPTLASTDILKDAYLDHVLLVAGNLATLLSLG